MSFLASTYAWQRRLLAGGLAFGAIGFWRATYDVFNTFKATVITLSLLGICVAGAIRVARTRRVHVPRNRAVWGSLAAFAVALLVATLFSGSPWVSVFGRAGRHTGLAMYLVYVGLLLTALRLHSEHSPAYLLKTLMAVAVPIIGYGLLQAVGVEPLGWKSVEGGPAVFSTFGNANFYASWVGVVVPLATWAALSASLSTPWRAFGAVLVPSALLAAFLSDSLPGPVIGVTGAALVLAVRILEDPGMPSARKRLALGGGGALLGLGALAFAAGLGPFGPLRASALRSLATRTPKWETALAMWRDHPLLGVGLDTFGDFFYRYRPATLAAATGLERSTDTPHNVFLDMLSTGGLLLALAYAAVTVVIAVALVGGLRRLRGEQRLLLAAVGGAWIAYQLQALVSIDVPPLAATGWVMGGLVLALGGQSALREVSLPGAPVATRRTGSGKKGKRRRTRPAERLVPLHPGIAAAVGIGALALAWGALLPLRADLKMGDAMSAQQRGDLGRAEDQLRAAGDIAFWESRYPARLGALLTSAGMPEEALAAHEEAARREPGGLAHWINVGRVAQTLDDDATASAAFERLLQLDPTTPETLLEVATYRANREDYATAERLLRRALEIDPSAEGAEQALDELVQR